MRKNNYSPYGTFSYEKVDAPKSSKKGAEKCGKISTGTDLRVGKKNGRA